jgi:Domain of unknown function (DUF4034)
VVAGSASFGGWIYKFRMNGEIAWKSFIQAVIIEAVTAASGGDVVAAGNELVIAYKMHANIGNRDTAAAVTFGQDGRVLSKFELEFPGQRVPSAVAQARDSGLLMLVDAGDGRVEIHKANSAMDLPPCLSGGRSALSIEFHSVSSKMPSVNYPVEEKRGSLSELTTPGTRKAESISVATACSSGETLTAGQRAAATTEIQTDIASRDQDDFIADVRRLMQKKDFQALDRIGNELRPKRERFANGDLKLYHLYQTVSGASAPSDEAKELAFIDEWRRRMPRSATAAVAAIAAFQNYAALARGEESASTVTEAAQEKFQRYLGRANAVLQSSA